MRYFENEFEYEFDNETYNVYLQATNEVDSEGRSFVGIESLKIYDNLGQLLDEQEYEELHLEVSEEVLHRDYDFENDQFSTGSDDSLYGLTDEQIA